MSSGGAYIQNSDALPIASPAASSPPIVELVKFIAGLFTSAYGLLSRTTVALVLSLLAPISLLYSPIAYLLAPVLVLAEALLDIFVLTPYAIFRWVAHHVYPFYVFVGSAVLCALFVGFLARALSQGLKRALSAPRRPSRALEEAPVPAGGLREKSAMKPTVAPKNRVRKRVSIKEERDR